MVEVPPPPPPHPSSTVGRCFSALADRRARKRNGQRGREEDCGDVARVGAAAGSGDERRLTEGPSTIKILLFYLISVKRQFHKNDIFKYGM